MTPQMIFALTYVPCVACVGMAYAFGGSIEKFFKIISFIFGGVALCSYSVFLLIII
tara:strand:- start:324 stop:491 length:168 start_codon:yes stop_codon:yes gene_type:complete